MKQEFVQVPVELVRGLKAARANKRVILTDVDSVARNIDALPDPPKPDVVEECEQARLNTYSREPMAGDCNRRALRAALRRYRELGCPELDE